MVQSIAVQADVAARAVPAGVARRAAIWGAPVLVLAVFAALTTTDPGELLVGVAFAVGTTTIALVGAVLADRAPANRIGAWLLLASILITASVALHTYATAGQAAIPSWPGAAAVASIADIPDVIAVVIILIGVPAIFPTGTLLSQRWWILIWVTVVAVLATSVSFIVEPGPLADAVSGVTTVAFVIGFVGALSSVGIRFRRGSPVEREQTKWFLAATAFAFAIATLAFQAPGDIGVILLMLALVAQPVAIGIAVLRYRLYAIDRIISRTIAYVVITVVLVIVYASVVLTLRTVVGGLIGDGSAEVVISTLVVASLFQPVRSRIQTALDHRFDRRHYDAERTVAAFSGHLRNEVHLDAVVGGLVGAAVSTVSPATSTIWLRTRDAGRH